MSSPNSSVRKYATPISRRVLTKKLEVLKIAALRNVDTVKEALLVAKKLRHDLEFELLNCPQHDILVAQDLQKLYINSTEISLVLLRVLDEQGIVLIGADEFLPNNKIYSVEKWLQQRFHRYPRGTPYVWGSSLALAAPAEVLRRSKLYIDAHHQLIRLEYNADLTQSAKKHATRSIVTILKGLVEPSATHHAAAIRSEEQMCLDPKECYLCLAQEDPVCDSCHPKIVLSHYTIVCKKIGNSLLDHVLRSKAEKLSQQYESSKQIHKEASEKNLRNARLETLRSRLEAARKHNQDKYQQIQDMKAQILVAKQENLAISGQHFAAVQLELSSIQQLYEANKHTLEEKSNLLEAARHTLLLDMHNLHHLDHGMENPQEVPGHPKVRLRTHSKAPSVSPGGGNIGASNATPVKAPKPNQPRPTWHFLHQAFHMDGNLLKTLPSPTTTLIPFFVFMSRIASWWNCALPHPIEATPIPRIFCPSLVNHHPSPGFTPLDGGWHAIPLVSANNISEYDANIHQMVADNARALIRAVATFSEEVIDLNDNWLNTYFFTFHTQYVRLFRPAQPLVSSSSSGNLASSFTLGSSTPPPSLQTSVFQSPVQSPEMPSSRPHRSRAASRIVVSYAPGELPTSPTVTPAPGQAVAATPIPPALEPTQNTHGRTSLLEGAFSMPRREEPSLDPIPIPLPLDPGWISFLR
jgi:hypothetical protein